MLSEILPSLAERSAFAKEICAAVKTATMVRAAGSGIAKAGPRRRQRAHRRCVREQLRSGAAVALRWLEAGGSEEHLRDGSTFTLPNRVEELFGSASRTSPLACEGHVRGRMRELMGEMLRQAPPRATSVSGTSAGSSLRDRLLGGVRGLHQHALYFRSPGAARLGSGCQAATPGSAVLPSRPGRIQALSTRRVHRKLTLRPVNGNGGRWCAAWCGADWRGACPQTLCHLVVLRGPSW